MTLTFFTTTDDLKLIANDLRLPLVAQGYEVETEKLDIYIAQRMPFPRLFELADRKRIPITSLDEK